LKSGLLEHKAHGGIRSLNIKKKKSTEGSNLKKEEEGEKRRDEAKSPQNLRRNRKTQTHQTRGVLRGIVM